MNTLKKLWGILKRIGAVLLPLSARARDSGAGPPADPGPAASPPAQGPPGPHGSLKIGSLKGAPGDG